MPNNDVACFAVDSLRQLSMKFLEKGEKEEGQRAMDVTFQIFFYAHYLTMYTPVPSLR